MNTTITFGSSEWPKVYSYCVPSRGVSVGADGSLTIALGTGLGHWSAGYRKGEKVKKALKTYASGGRIELLQGAIAKAHEKG
jgi:hypothetical protein